MADTDEKKEENFYALEKSLVFQTLGTGEDGLSSEEVVRRVKLHGSNTLPGKRRLGRVRIFLNQWKSPLILILLFAALVTFFLREYGNTSVIVLAVLSNTLLGYYQENKAEEALEKIKTYVVERCVVKRDGKRHEIDSRDLVLGDIIYLRYGSRVPADARVISANDVLVDEAVLTGESLPQEKGVLPVAYSTPLGDRASMLYSGTALTNGSCRAVVTATGFETEIGKIAKLVEGQAGDQTPLQKQIAKFSMDFGAFVFVAAGALFFLGISYGREPVDMFLITVAVAVAAVPEGLPITLTVVLAVGVRRLAERGGVVRKLLAAETLGSTSVILTDKTGTLTEAKMKMEDVVDYGGAGDLISKIAVLNCDVIIENPDANPNDWELIGANPLEIAIVEGAARLGVLKPAVTNEMKPSQTLPFSADKKFSAVVMQHKHTRVAGFFGAPEVLLNGSTYIMSSGRKKPLTKDEREDIFEEIDALAYAGKRVLGVSMREFPKSETRINDIGSPHKNSVFMGLVILTDPVRSTAKAAIKKIRESGVQVAIITGDHRGTAESVAKELGFLLPEGAVMVGAELEAITTEELARRIDNVVLYARITPSGKLKILEAFQARGDIVAMTGDGVNDAPALKSASIGIALGSGTDVAKDVSDLVMLDNDFSVIVAAIEEGRKIYHNVRKSIVYLLSSGFTEIILVVGTIFVGIPLPFEAFALQILWINIFSDSFPAVALAFENSEESSALLHSEGGVKKLLDGEMKIIIFVVGILTSILLFAVAYFLYRASMPVEILLTVIFAALGVSSIIVVYSIRNLSRSIFEVNLFQNQPLNLGVGFGLFMIVAAVYVPLLNDFLRTVPLPATYWLGIILLGIINITLIEGVKSIFRYMRSAAAHG